MTMTTTSTSVPDRVLVLVKATPQPSRTYGDTVCVAGVDLGATRPSWRRLYPVPFRYLDGDQQFRKYDVISVRTRDPSADKRPESRSIVAPTIERVSHVDGWTLRAGWIEPLVGPTMCELIRGTRADINAQSLGAVRPAELLDLRFSRHPGWTSQELQRFDEYRQQGDLFREAPPRLLDPPPWIVRLIYRCQTPGCDRHEQRIIDWELTALQSRYRRNSEAEQKAAITHNFLEQPFAPNRAPLIFVGNQENVQRRSAFTVLGLYYPKQTELPQAETLF